MMIEGRSTIKGLAARAGRLRLDMHQPVWPWQRLARILIDAVAHSSIRRRCVVMIARHLLCLPPSLRVSLLCSTRVFSVLNRPPPNYEGHVPLNVFEKGALAAGSAIMSLINPRRGGTSDEAYHTRLFTDML